VLGGDNVGGFIVGGSVAKTVVARGIGPVGVVGRKPVSGPDTVQDGNGQLINQ
jgi:hypothetical protein